MATLFWVNIGSGYGFLLDDDKPLPECSLGIIGLQHSGRFYHFVTWH